MSYKRLWLVAISTMVLIACASKPSLIWTNEVNPQRVFVGDDQECQVIAQSLTANSGSTGYLRATLQVVQWRTCMEARGWRRVEMTSNRPTPPRTAPNPSTATDVAFPFDSSALDTTYTASRWYPLTIGSGFAVAMDTTRISEVSKEEGWYDTWIRYEYTPDQPLGQSAVHRMVPHTYLDCKNKRVWITQVYLYSADGTLITTGDLSKNRWQAPAPESTQESIVIKGCALIRWRTSRNNQSR